MDAPYLTLLNQAASVTANAFGRIDESITKNMQLQQQASQFEVETMGKAMQFAETQRMHDAQIDSWKAENSIRAQQLELERQTLPLKIETERLRLAATKYRFEQDKKKTDSENFNQITDLEDEAAGYALIKSQDPNHAKELIENKAYFRGLVANGQPFNQVEYRKKVEQINNKYASVTADPKAPFNESTHYLLGEISPKVQSSYERSHPRIMESQGALATSYLSWPDNDVDTFIKNYSTLYGDADFGSINIGRDVFKRNNENIERWSKGVMYEDNNILKLTAEDNKEGLAVAKQNKEAYLSKIQEAKEQNDTIRSNFAKRNYTTAKELESKKITDPQLNVKDLSGFSNEGKPKGDAIGFPNSTDPAATKKFHKIEQLEHAVSQGEEDRFKTELGGALNLKWAYDKFTNRVDTESLNSVRNTIEDNLESMEAVGENLGKAFNREKVSSVLQLIESEQAVPLDPWTSKRLYDTNKATGLLATITDYTRGENPMDDPNWFDKNPMQLRFKAKKGALDKVMSGGLITSYDDIFELTKGIKNKSERQAIHKTIYAALLTAGVKQGVEAE